MEDILNVFIVLFAGVGVIKTEVADTIVLLGDTKVHADGFGVTYMQISVRLRGETSLDTASVFTFSQVLLDELFNET